jgi:hypothetical protein
MKVVSKNQKIPAKKQQNTDNKQDQKNRPKFFLLIEKYPFAVFFSLLVIILLIVFKDFIFLKKLYLFKDIGSDTINTFYPQRYMNALNRELGLAYTFTNGMGAAVNETKPGFFGYIALFLRNPLNFWYHFVPAQKIHIALFYYQLCNIVSAAVVFFFYLRTINFSKYASILGALLFSFSGTMIIGSGWYHHTGELLNLALFLLAFELYFKRGIWFLLPIMVALTFSVYFWYINAVFFFFYVMFRYLDETNFELKAFLGFSLKLSGLVFLGILISLPELLEQINNILNQPRVSGNLSKSAQMQEISVFATADLLHNLTSVYRFFANDILGSGKINLQEIGGNRIFISEFKGYGNFYEAPMFYIGLLTLLLFPQLFINIEAKKRVIYTILLVLWVIPIIFPFFRRAYFLFFGDYYRIFSFFLPFVLLFFTLKVLTIPYKINILLLIGTFVVLASVLLINFLSPADLIKYNLTDNPIDRGIRNNVLIFLTIYAAIFMAFHFFGHYREHFLMAILIVVLIELCVLSYPTINNRMAVSNSEFKQKIGFNDYTIEAVDYLKSIDRSFYRTVKEYSSGIAVHNSLNGSMIQGFFGTARYASFQGAPYTDFLESFEIVKPGDEEAIRWSTGLRYRPLLRITANVKYHLTKDENSVFKQYAYSPINKTGDVIVMKNNLYLPLGFTYQKFIPESRFDSLDTNYKRIVLFEAVVVNDSLIKGFDNQLSEVQIDTSIYNNINQGSIENWRKELMEDTLSIRYWKQDQFKGSIEIEKPKLLYFSILQDDNWKLTINGEEKKPIPCNIGFMGTMLDKGVYEIELKYINNRPKEVYIQNMMLIASILVLTSIWLYMRKKRTE